MRNFSYNSGNLNGGMNNKKDDIDIARNQLAEVQNVIFDDNNNPQKRPGIFSSTATGEEWKTGITETAAVKSSENLYTHKDSAGNKYLVAFAGTTVKYTTNLVDWTDIKTDFNTAYKVRFASFKDKLIMTNGYDDVFTWDGTNLLQANGFVTADGAAGNVTDGVHLLKITYKYDSKNYAYDAVISHTAAGSKTLVLTKLPIPPAYGVDITRKVWMTEAGGSVYYLAATITDPSLTTATIDMTDATLTGEGSTAYTALSPVPESVKPPKCRYVAVADNRLFLSHSFDADSEVYWSEAGGLEFPGQNVQGLDVNDGRQITGMITFKANNRVMVWKQKGMWAGASTSDSYTFSQVSSVGCDFPDSIQEFNIADEYGERDTILWGNREGVWEWGGSTSRKISDQPNGSSIQKTWELSKQRDVIFQKNAITTDAGFNTGDYEGIGVDALNNWAQTDTGANRMNIKNIMTWNDTTGIKPESTNVITAMCWDVTNKKIYTAEFINSALGNTIYEYTWTGTGDTKAWVKNTTPLVGNSNFGYSSVVTKMQYDATTDRIYCLVQSGSDVGVLIRTTAGITAWDEATLKSVNVSGIGATISRAASLYTVINQSSNTYIRFIGASITKGSTTSTGIPFFVISNYNATDDFYISHRTTITNPTAKNIYYERKTASAQSCSVVVNTSGDVSYNGFDGYIPAGDSVTLQPGCYVFALAEKSVDNPFTLSYTSAGRLDFEINGDNLYYVDCAKETLGGTTYPKYVIKRLLLSTWGTAEETNFVSRSDIFLSVNNGRVFASGSKETTSGTGYNSFVSSITGLTLTNRYTTTDYETREMSAIYRVVSIGFFQFKVTYEFIFNQQKLSDGVYSFGYALNEGTVPTTNSVIKDTTQVYNNTNKSLNLIKNVNGNLFYYVDNTTKELMEINLSGTVVSLKDDGHVAGSYSALVYCYNINADKSIPDMLIPITDTMGHNSTTSTFWRGVYGNYNLLGDWLLTGASNIDTGADSSKLTSLLLDTTQATEHSLVSGWLYTSVAANETINKRTSGIMVPVTSGDTNIDGSSENTPGNGKVTITLLGKARYVHEYIQLNYNVYADMKNSDSATFLSPNLNAIVLSWIDVKGGTTLPQTDVVSTVHGNRYYLAFVEKRTQDSTNKDEKVNNIIAVFDRYKRWSFWRGRPCFVRAFAVFDDRLMMSDAYLTGTAEVESDYIYVLGERGDINGFVDHDVTSSPASTVAIDAYIITKNFDLFDDRFDSPRFKKQLRHIYITSQTFDASAEGSTTVGTYNLEFGWRPDERKYDADGIGYSKGQAYWTVKNFAVGVDDLTGKINGELNFPNYQPAKRHQFRFRNNTANQDFGFMKFELEGKVFHAR